MYGTSTRQTRVAEGSEKSKEGLLLGIILPYLPITTYLSEDFVGEFFGDSLLRSTPIDLAIKFPSRRG